MKLLIITLISVAMLGAQDPIRIQDRVEDQAGILAPSTVNQLTRRLAELEETDSTQIVVLTVKSTGGVPVSDFAIEVAQANGIGQKDRSNGALVLVVSEDRTMRIEVGRGLEATLTDARCGRILDREMRPAFRRGDFDGGVLAGTRAVIDAVRGAYVADAPLRWAPFFGIEDLVAVGLLLTGLVLVLVGKASAVVWKVLALAPVTSILGKLIWLGGTGYVAAVVVIAATATGMKERGPLHGFLVVLAVVLMIVAAAPEFDLLQGWAIGCVVVGVITFGLLDVADGWAKLALLVSIAGCGLALWSVSLGVLPLITSPFLLLFLSPLMTVPGGKRFGWRSGGSSSTRSRDEDSSSSSSSSSFSGGGGSFDGGGASSSW